MTRVATNWYHTQRLLAVRRWGRGYRAGRPTDAVGMELGMAVGDADASERTYVARQVIELAAFRASAQRAER